MNQLYQSTPDGLCGDEDTGQMSSWYLFSALGFYPVCPGTTDYAIGSPLFDRATVTLPGGKNFVVTARRNGPQRPYIEGATLNGQPFQKMYLTHEQIVGGGEVVFRMTSAPDYKWATAPASRPLSAMSPLRGNP
jgi:putative alpha-1,2-mannosidase